MHVESDGKGRVSPVSATDRKLSRQLQRCLRLAEVDRADLFIDDATRKSMTAHDLRATGVTWAALRGDDVLKIKQRAGHKLFSTTEIYIREAENLRAVNFGTPFPPLPADMLKPPPSESVGNRPVGRFGPQKHRQSSGGAGNRTRVRKFRGQLRLRAYPAVCIVLDCAGRRARPKTIHLFDLASRPVTRRSASQFVDGLLQGTGKPWVDRLSGLLFRQREQLRYRSQLCFPRGFYVVPRDPRHAASWSRSPSKPIAPDW